MKILEYSQNKTKNESKSALSETLSFAACSALGSVFLSLMSQLSLPLPFTPVPVTLQTLALLLLVVAQGKSKATGSVALYLGQATLGLPVLAGGIANPLWLLSPTAGYLLGFLGCAWVAGYLLEKRKAPSFLWTLMSLAAGQGVVFLLGTLYLSIYVGMDKAFMLGVVPFLSGAVIKLFAAAFAEKPIAWVKRSFLGKGDSAAH